MRQTFALLLDAYRELNSKKLFWITMFISLLVVAVYAMFGLNDRGLTFLWWTFDLPLLNTKVIPADRLYKFMFANIGIPVWLTWAATILALISTASIIPDFIAGGAIELTLSKPISRARLFLTKFATGLLFVGLQVLVFTAACFLVIGIRGGAWEFRLFLAVPIVLVFFSYLFSVCALLGLVTRSTIASLLITILVWLLFWGVNTTDTIFIAQRERTRLNVERTTRTVERGETLARRQIEKARSEGTPVPGIDAPLPSGAADELEAFNGLLHGARAEREKARLSAATWERWSGYMYGVKTVLPKTDDTIHLLNRYLLTPEDLAFFQPERRRRDRDDEDEARADLGDPEVARRAELAVRDRSVAWVLGTSLAFETLVLGIATLIFVRRDF